MYFVHLDIKRDLSCVWNASYSAVCATITILSSVAAVCNSHYNRKQNCRLNCMLITAHVRPGPFHRRNIAVDHRFLIDSDVPIIDYEKIKFNKPSTKHFISEIIVVFVYNAAGSSGTLSHPCWQQCACLDCLSALWTWHFLPYLIASCELLNGTAACHCSHICEYHTCLLYAYFMLL